MPILHRNPLAKRFSFVTVMLVVAILLTALHSTSASTSPVSEPAAFTASGIFDFSTEVAQAADPEDLLLVGLASTADGSPDLFALRWSRVTRGWFPSWSLRITSQDGQLSGANSSLIDLDVLTPEAGHVYEWALSYDPGTNVLSVTLTDATTGNTVAATGLALLPHEGEVHLVSSSPITDTQPRYIPLASRLQVGERSSSGAFFPISRFEPQEKVWLNLNVPGGKFPGSFELQILTADGAVLSTHALDVTDEQLLIPLPSELPLGASRLVVVYTEAGEVLRRHEQNVQIGAVATDFARAERTSLAGPISTGVAFQSASDLPPVHVAVHATLAEIVWDQDTRSYHTMPLETELVLYTGELNLTANELFTLPLELDPPTEPGTYRLTLQPTFTPDVAGHVTNMQTHFTTHEPATIAPGEPYTIAIFPDTQIYAIRHPITFFRMAEWLAAQAKERNIAFALHVGDITNDNNPPQWNVATNALKLLNHAVPYVLALGNHDYVPPQRPGGGQVYSRDDSLIHDYFGARDFPHMAGTMTPERLDNTYHLFEVADKRYLVVSLEFAPSDEAIDWANEVVAAHPEHTAIILTHQYLRANGTPVPRGSTANYEIANDPTTSVNDGTDIWHKLLRLHPTIEWAISGHRLTPTIPYRITLGDHRNRVYQLLADYQGEPDGGGGHLILMTFHPDDTVEIRAYSPYQGVYKTEIDTHGFTNHLSINLTTGRVTRLELPNDAVNVSAK